MNYIFFAVTIAVVVPLFFLLNKLVKKRKDWILKSFSLLLAIVFFIRYYSVRGSLLSSCLNLSYQNPFGSAFICFSVVILVWLMFAQVVILILLPFFKYNILKNYAKYFCLIVNIFALVYMRQIIYSFTGSYNLSLCGAFIAVEIGISLLYSIYIFVANGCFKLSKRDIIEVVCALPIVLLFSVPSYLFSTLFGTVGAGQVTDLELYHRIYIYLTFIILFGLYFILRNREKEYIRLALLYISLTTLITYCNNYDFSSFLSPSSWPLHLCNTAMFILPVCLIFKLSKLFYFTFFINVLGAFFALLMPNYADFGGFFAPNVVSFWINHIIAFALPLLIVFLNIYERPKLKQFIYSMVGFLLYFVLVVFLNSYFTASGTEVDFFFVNSNYIAEKLGVWAENLRNYTLNITIGSKTLEFYPVYQSLFFVVYVCLGLCVWFLYAWLFQLQDFYIALAEKKRKIKQDEIALCVKYGKKEVEECMNKESVNKLVVKNVFKRYGNNKNYSVMNISFEVDAGEILGFLGPNGAGKSTIIKSIVGIQPVTSGSIEINGYDIEKQPTLAKAQFGFVPDHYALYEKLTGREYINYIADLYGVTKEERDARLKKMLKDLSMEGNIDSQIRTYSHGMKQKITIMSALIHNPKLWILDEPLTGLDPNSIYEVKECMKKHAESGNIVFFSSHIIDIVEKLCNRIIIIKNGQIVTSVTLEELKEQNISLEEFYLNIINSKTENAIANDENKNNEDVLEIEEMQKKEVKNKKPKKVWHKSKSKNKEEEQKTQKNKH